MSWLTVIWTACTVASGMLAGIHFLLWYQYRERRFYLFSALACFAATAVTWGELALMKAPSFDAANGILIWQSSAIALLIVSLTWFVFKWFGTGSRTLAIAITAVWGIALISDLMIPGNPVFAEITRLEPHETFWGETFVIAGGTANPFRWLGDLASVLFLSFVTHASIRLGRRGNPRRAWSVGGVIVFFILSAGIHTPLVDAGFIKTPYLVGFLFLAIILGLTRELVRDVARSSKIADELRRVRGELEHIGRVNLLGELSAALAHELNQPLTAILSNAQAGSRFLKAENPDLDEIADILKDIANDDKRAREVIRRIRSLLEKGESNRDHIELNQAIEEAVTLLRTELKNARVTLALDLAPSLPTVWADRLGIQQVIVNLILNAERAAASGPSGDRAVIVRSSQIGNAISIEVEDTGKGINTEALSKIFDPFFTTESSGLGMGLSICRTIIENHGGKIRAKNRDGGGAIFTISLPVENENNTP